MHHPGRGICIFSQYSKQCTSTPIDEASDLCIFMDSVSDLSLFMLFVTRRNICRHCPTGQIRPPRLAQGGFFRFLGSDSSFWQSAWQQFQIRPSRNAAEVNRPGRKPWDAGSPWKPSPNGEREACVGVSVAPLGLPIVRVLTPRAYALVVLHKS